MRFPGKLTLLLGALSLASMASAFAEPLEFRADGFFSSPDGEVKVFWDEPYRFARLTLKGKDLIVFRGPATMDGKVSPWYLGSPKAVPDKASKSVSVTGSLPDGGGNFSVRMSEKDDGVLMELSNDLKGSPVSNFRALLPVPLFAGKEISWSSGKLSLPAEWSKAGERFFASNSFSPLEIPLDDARTLSLKSVLPVKDAMMSDCRSWGEANYHFTANMVDGKAAFLLQIKSKDGAKASKGGNLLQEGASFEAGPDGMELTNRYSWNEKMTTPGEPPAFDSSTAAHGKFSLKIKSDLPSQHNGRFAFVGAIFKRVLLERGKTYTVSAWLKGDRPGMQASMFCGENTWGGAEWRPFPVSTEWKRYSKEFKTGDFEKSAYCVTWIGVPQGREGTLWMDAVQLEEGPMTDFKPSSQLEFGVEVTEPFKLFEKGSACQATARIRNNGDAPFEGTVDYQVLDFWGKQARKGSVAVKAAPGSNSEAALALGELPCGYYKLLCKLVGEEEEAIFGVYRPQPLTLLPDDWPLACHNDPSPIVRKLGFGMVRAFDVFQFSNIAPTADSFNFAGGDKFVEDLERSGLSAMPIFDTFGWPHYRHDPPVPPYAQEKVDERVFQGGKHRLAWPKIEAWKRYVKALTSHYKGRIKYWEVLNEPNLVMTAEEYMPYLKAAYEAAKEGDPGCKVVGLCGTSDFQGKPDSYSRQVFKLGGSAYFDLSSVHMYGQMPPERSVSVGSDKALDSWRKLLKDEYGKVSDIWHTEKSYISAELGYSKRKVPAPVEYCDEPQFLIKSPADKANWMIRETLLSAVGGGRGKFFWFGEFYSSKFISHRIYAPFVLDHTEYDDSPMPELVAANGLAWALDGMNTPEGQMDWGDTNRCVIFSGPKGSMAALWRISGSGKIAIPAGKAKCEAMNFFGEKLECPPNAESVVAIEIDETAKYVRFEGLSTEACFELLKKAKLLEPDPVKQSGSMILKDGAPAWKFSFSNPQLTAVDASVSASCPEGWSVQPLQQSFKAVKGGSKTEAIFPLKDIPARSAGDAFVFKSSLDGKVQECQAKTLPFESKAELLNLLSVQDSAIAKQVPTDSIAIDGDLGEWSGEGAISLSTEASIKEANGVDGWKGPYDCSATLRLRWDKSFLYVAARVFDDVPRSPGSCKTAYEDDCLELLLSPDGGNVLQGFFFPLEKSYSGSKCWWPAKSGEMGTKVACKPMPGGYALEIAIPWSELGCAPKAGQSIPFTFHVDDSDAPGQLRKTVLIWKGDTGNFLSSKQWGALKLVE